MKHGRDIRVGLFVLAGLVLSGVVIFLIGDERRLFASSQDFRTTFHDVQGLKPGAPIRMGGIDIGHVDTVGYGKNAKDTTIYVTLSIVKSEAGRIKTDSVVRIATKGLLGDKMIEITKGKAAESIPPNGEIQSEEEADVMSKVAEVSGKATEIIDNLKKVSESLADEKLHKDLHEAVGSLRDVLDSVAHGNGYAHRLIADRGEADRISHTVATVDQATQELSATMRDVHQIVARVEQGPGFAHDIVYGKGPEKQVEQFGNAAQELATTLKGVRESDSLAHDFLYGGKGNGAEAIANIAAITADLRTIVGNVKAGKGTIGALLVDPSVYEDLKMVLGNVKRNDVLRALVRYSIKQDEKRPGVEVGTGR